MKRSVNINRYAVYYVPPADAEWAHFCTRWLGWDVISGSAPNPPNIPTLPVSLNEITQTPRKYGLHGTLKPPFRLKQGLNPSDLEDACADMVETISRFQMPGLELARLGRFLALRPVGDQTEMTSLAANCVRKLDQFRTPPEPEELARRRASNLSPQQDGNLMKWGYPYVLNEFRFHITLSSRLPKPELRIVEDALNHHLVPLLPMPFVVNDIALVGEDAIGNFHLIRRFSLRGG